MKKRSLLLRLPAVLLAALRRPLGRPGVVVLLLLINLAAALVVVAPVRSLLSAELDHNLYGERMDDGTSWRWFDTVERQHPQAVGDGSAWSALFSDEGVRWTDLAAVSGPPAALLLAALVLFLLHAPLHVGYLATGAHAVRRHRQPGGREGATAAASRDEPVSAVGGGVPAVLVEAVAKAPAALALAALAVLAYVAVYALVFVAPAAPLARFAEFLQRESVHLLQVWLRLGLTVLGLLVVKAAFDLAKLGLAVEGGATSVGGWRRRWGLLAALRLAGRELRARGIVYLLAELVLGALLVVVAAAWWFLSDPLVPETWLGLLILFVLHQLFVAVRIVLRLAHLEAAAEIHGRAAAPPAAAVTPPAPEPTDAGEPPPAPGEPPPDERPPLSRPPEPPPEPSS